MKYEDALGRLESVTVYPGYATAKCPAHPDASPSLSIVRDHDNNAWVTCWAGCDWRKILEAISSSTSGERRVIPTVSYDPEHNKEAALKIWDEAYYTVGGSPVETYLKNRGLNNGYTTDIRYHRALRHSSGAYFPAMVTAITDVEGEVVGIHRTYLTVDGKKAEVQPNKMMLGNCRGGAVRFRGRTAADDSTVFITEGIETALSIRQLFGDVQVYAALSVYGLRSIQLPSWVKRVIVVADGDQLGTPAFMAAQRAVVELRRRGLEVVMLRCPFEDEDFNDILQKKEGRLCSCRLSSCSQCLCACHLKERS